MTVRVEDDGPGIPEEERERLFEPTEGTGVDHGLGLIIVGRLAERYGGRVDLVETGPDGTTFAVELMRVDPQGDGAPPQEDDAPDPLPAGGGHRRTSGTWGL